MRFARMARLILAAALIAAPALAPAEDSASQARKLRGYELYQASCARCHGPDGIGDGPDAGETRVPTANLTLIAARRGGVFPDAEVQQIIDGRRAMRAHGPSGMPVWGNEFSPPVSAGGPAQVAVKDKIHLLAEYLKAIQLTPEAQDEESE